MKHSLFWLLDDYPDLGESPAARYDAALQLAAEADRLGFTSLWIAEHHVRTIGTAPNPAVLLAAIAQRTTRIRLGPAISVLPLRAPISVAEDYALVDVLSGGRLNMGVGSGSSADEYAPFGVDFDARRETFVRHLEHLRELWSAAASGEGGAVSINVAPLQRPTPPIYLATFSEESAYRIGLAGDSLLTFLPPSSETLDPVTAVVDAHARGLDAAGLDDGSAESIVMLFAHVADTEAAVRETAVPALARLMRNMTGTEPPDADAFYDQVRRHRGGVFGTPIEMTRQLDELAARGIGHIALVSRFGGMPVEAAARSLERLAPRPSVADLERRRAS